MSLISSPIPWLLIIPLSGAVLTMLLPGRLRSVASLLGISAQLIASFSLLLLVQNTGPVTYALGDWQAPLGIALRADGLATLFVLMSTLVSTVCALYAQQYLTREKLDGFWPLFWFLCASLNGIWLAADSFNLYVCLELLTLSAVGLVAFAADEKSLEAAIRYLYAALLGSMGYLLGVALLYGAHGTLALDGLASHWQAGATSQVAIALILAGLMLKTAVFPLHTWLPPAHGGALTPVSALLSALVIKASLYILLRFWIELDIYRQTPALSQLLGVFGSGAILWGGWMAMHQQQLKMVIAYSTLVQVGYMLLMFPLLTAEYPEATIMAYQGGILMLLAHALAKAGMFLAAGNLILCTGKPELTALAGMSRYRPMNIFAFGLAGVSIMGLPPSGGFSGKWLLLQSSLISQQWWWTLVMLLGSLLSAAYIFRVFAYTYRETGEGDTFAKPALSLELIALCLSASSILLGFMAMLPLELISLPGPLRDSLP
ncbi:complex I subunit 5 family protein [Nitrincola iocasae]|uniref:Hydrogenase 4 subunit B n=1 Tax=Nitrincola iocasae TaxID=2614693 RepID=A0A5J6LGV8_9GAMM|nr:proton-conducting transporter membrane subunit [Nitrincola iocasae]QEW07837.1 hydrogenase 4 subunit B [Nitrincola iocasae]